MRSQVFREEDRGFAEHGWLKAKHSFSFASYHDPNKMNFGLLRVLNDDIIAPGQGFGTHPHQNMEIVTIPLKGSLKHKDSQGNEKTITSGEVQAMSAGTGVTHSEFNGSNSEDVNLLQIWILPEKQNIEPRYDQKIFSVDERTNKFQKLVAPLDSSDEAVKINQQAYFSMANIDVDKVAGYEVNITGNGVYLFVVKGEVEVAGETLKQRDAIGLTEAQSYEVKASQAAEVLVIEVPMS